MYVIEQLATALNPASVSFKGPQLDSNWRCYSYVAHAHTIWIPVHSEREIILVSGHFMFLI